MMIRMNMIRKIGMGLLSASLLMIFGCRINDEPLTLECAIENVSDNMPYNDDDFVSGFTPYPRRIRLGCTLTNTSRRIISLPFETYLYDSICSSRFKVMINHSDEIPVWVVQIGSYDKFNIQPKETVCVELTAFIYRYKEGMLATMPLMDLLSQLEVVYEKQNADESLSENEMVDLHFVWKDDLYIDIDEKADRTSKCYPY